MFFFVLKRTVLKTKTVVLQTGLQGTEPVACYRKEQKRVTIRIRAACVRWELFPMFLRLTLVCRLATNTPDGRGDEDTWLRNSTGL